MLGEVSARGPSQDCTPVAATLRSPNPLFLSTLCVHLGGCSVNAWNFVAEAGRFHLGSELHFRTDFDRSKFEPGTGDPDFDLPNSELVSQTACPELGQICANSANFGRCPQIPGDPQLWAKITNFRRCPGRLLDKLWETSANCRKRVRLILDKLAQHPAMSAIFV